MKYLWINHEKINSVFKGFPFIVKTLHYDKDDSFSVTISPKLFPNGISISFCIAATIWQIKVENFYFSFMLAFIITNLFSL